MVLSQKMYVYVETMVTCANQIPKIEGYGSSQRLGLKAANSRRDYWLTTLTVSVNMVMTKERLINSGFYDLAAAYQSVHVNYLKRCIREPYVKCCERMAVGHRLILASKYKCYELIIYKSKQFYTLK